MSSLSAIRSLAGRRLSSASLLRTGTVASSTAWRVQKQTSKCWLPHRGLAAQAVATEPRYTTSDDSLRQVVQTDDLPIVSQDDRKVAIGWDTQRWSRFHNIWLRDHCRCPQCFHPVTKQRLFDTFEIPSDIRHMEVKATSSGLEVTWPSQVPHVSFYPWSWLQLHSYDPPLPGFRSEPERIMWGSKIEQSPPTVSYEEVMEGDEGLHRWLKNIDTFGFSFVKGVPATLKDTEELARRIAFLRETQYGGFWDFTSDLSKGDTAYTTLALGAHTDNTYYTDPCGLQLFHLLSHTGGTGGATLLVDGYYVASILKELHPNLYDLLARIPVPGHAAGEETSLYRPSPPLGYPVLDLDRVTGRLNKVRWNNDDRSVMSHLEPGVVEEWYEAIRTWNKLLKSPDSEYWVQLEPGSAVVINNHRVLHGRSAFDGKRRMCGAYIGIDEFNSKLAVLDEKALSDSTSATPAAPTETRRSVWNALF